MSEQAANYLMVGNLMEETPGEQNYTMIAKNMINTELQEALERETRPEGIRILKTVAVNRGLIEGEPELESESAPTAAGAQMVPVEQLYPNPNNPRKNFDQEELDKLTASVQQLGVLSPILVVADGEKYRIVAGERRYRAAKAAELDEVPVLIREITPEQEFEIMLTENIQRKDLDPIEEAQAFQTAVEQGWKQVELAERLGISQAQVANRLRLLKLPESVQENISCEILSAGHGLALTKVAHVPKVAEEIAEVFTKLNTPVARASEIASDHIAKNYKPLFEDTWGAPDFDYQTICVESKCIMRVHGKATYDDEEHPYCLERECWEKHQEEAEKAAIEKHVKEELGEDTDVLSVPHTNELDDDSYEYFGKRFVQLKDCEGCEHIADVLNYNNELRKVCMNPACYQAKVDRGWKKEQEDRQAEEDGFVQRKLEIVENFNCLDIWDPDSVNSAIFMALRVFELTAGNPSQTWMKYESSLFRYLNIEIPNGLTWEEESAILEKHLREMKSIPDMIDVILFLLLNSARPYNKSWQLTFGADKPEQEGEAS